MAGWKLVIVSGSSPEFANIDVDGYVSASFFAGDGSGLTNLPSAAISSFTNGVDNYVVTATSATGVNGEINLTFDGSTLTNLGNTSLGNGTGDTFSVASNAPTFTNILSTGTGNEVVVDHGSGVLRTQTIDALAWTGIPVGTVTSVAGGTGITQTGTSTVNPTINVDYLGADNILMSAPTLTAPVAADYMMYADTGDSSNAKKSLISGIGLQHFDNSTSAFSTTVGTVTTVTAGALIDVTNPTTTATIDVDLSELATSTADTDGDFFAVVDGSNVQRKLTKANIALSGFNDDIGISTTVGTVTSVTAGAGMTQTGTSTINPTLNIITHATGGLDIQADSIAVDINLFTTSNTVAGADYLAFYNIGDTDTDKALISTINLSAFNNDSSWTSNVGTVTSVTGGTGIDSTGGTTPDITLDIFEVTTATLATADYMAFTDTNASNGTRKALISTTDLGLFNNDQGWTSTSGTVTGTGTDNRIAVWSGGSSLDSTAGFEWDGSTLDVGGDVIITGDLTVQGDVFSVQVTNVNIEDQFILLNSGSGAAADVGIIFGNSNGTDQEGWAFYYDSTFDRLAVTETDVAWDDVAATPTAFIPLVYSKTQSHTEVALVGNMRIETNDDIYIYVD